MGLNDDIGPGPVGLDTAAFIYFIEDEARYAPLLAPLFARAGKGVTIVTSALTLLEVLVVPLRQGHWQLAERYEQLLAHATGVALLDITREQLRAAATLRATRALKTPDALQVAAALSAGCRTFVTNDRRLPAIPGLRVLQLSDYV